ncbi:MAG: hypothetical protein GY757_23070 [bacterium]|nr:hypothetical protein [bacterium]
MLLLKKLEILKDVPGYLGAGVFTYDGKMIGGVTEISGINFEIAGSLIHDALLFLNNNCREAGFGPVDLLQINARIGIVLAKCFQGDDTHFHTMMVLKHDSNVARAKLMLEKAAKALKEELITKIKRK